jgi:hypothetical protein
MLRRLFTLASALSLLEMRGSRPPVNAERYGWSAGEFNEFWGERNFGFPFGFGRNRWPIGTYQVTSVPYWFVFLLVALPPLCGLPGRSGGPQSRQCDCRNGTPSWSRGRR